MKIQVPIVSPEVRKFLIDLAKRRGYRLFLCSDETFERYKRSHYTPFYGIAIYNKDFYSGLDSVSSVNNCCAKVTLEQFTKLLLNP